MDNLENKPLVWKKIKSNAFPSSQGEKWDGLQNYSEKAIL